MSYSKQENFPDSKNLISLRQRVYLVIEVTKISLFLPILNIHTLPSWYQRAAEYAPQNMTRSSGHAPLKYTALVTDYFELQALEKEKIQGEVFSELPLPV